MGAGSSIVADVPAGALGIARGRQNNVEGWASDGREVRARHSPEKRSEYVRNHRIHRVEAGRACVAGLRRMEYRGYDRRAWRS